MSQVKVSGNASGTGIFEIAAPNSSTNRTLTLPDATGTIQVSDNPISGTTASFSGNVTLGSSVLETPSGTAPSYVARAWVNWNGVGTVAIRASGNVSSITDGGVGTYTVNFTTAMPNATYALIGSSSYYPTSYGAFMNTPYGVPTTSSVRVLTASGGTTYDTTYNNLAIFC